MLKEKTLYREMIGSLMYAAVITCPDIAYTITTLSQYLKMPTMTHLVAIKCVFAYLLGTTHLKLILGSKNLGVIGFSDADWVLNLH